MYDGCFFWLFNAAGTYFTSGEGPTRGKEFTNGGSARYQVYPTKDGHYLAVGALEDHFWQNLCDLLGIEDPRIRLHDREYSDLAIEVLTEKFRDKTAKAWANAFQGKDVCANVIRDFKEASFDPHFQSSGMIQQIIGPDGETQRVLGNPIRMSETSPQIRDAAPLLGRDNQKILTELGYSDQESRLFLDEGVI